jgi:hypothetical protein
MYLDLVIGEFKLNITLTCGNLFKRFKRKKSADTYEATIADTYADTYADTSAETYEEEIINFYDVNKVNKIQAQADKFSSELELDSNGLYDIPPDYKNELEEFMSDVEIIDDAYENAMQDKLERVRGY